MAELIYMADRWRIERQPGSITDPMVVGFVKGSAVRKLLDQTARWTPTGWDPKRWVPKSPTVPQWLIQKVEDYMRQTELP